MCFSQVISDPNKLTTKINCHTQIINQGPLEEQNWWNEFHVIYWYIYGVIKLDYKLWFSCPIVAVSWQGSSCSAPKVRRLSCLQSALGSWRSGLQCQWRKCLNNRTERTSRQKAKTSFFHVLYTGCYQMLCPKFIINLLTSNDPLRKSLPGMPRCWG